MPSAASVPRRAPGMKSELRQNKAIAAVAKSVKSHPAGEIWQMKKK